MTEQDIIYILLGIYTTIGYTLTAIFFGFFIAIPIALMRMSKQFYMQVFAKSYVSIIRGTPVLLQLSFWYFAMPRIIGINFSPFTAGAIAFSINSSAYVAEIIRAGITSVDKGQAEAAQVLGITKRETFLNIILPQAIKNISPAIVNEMISMTKETAIIGFIGVTDITRRAQLVSAEKYNYFGPLIIAAISYYCLAVGISIIYSFIARKYRL